MARDMLSRFGLAMATFAALASPAASIPPAAREEGGASAGAAAGSPDVDWKSWAEETRKLLKEIVAIDTTNPPGQESTACERLRQVLATDGIEGQVLASAPGRGNLVARLKGTGGKGAMLWLAHLDVVGVKGQPWKVEPFLGVEKDGYLYGRGVIDDKGMAVLGVQLVRLLKRTGARLSRDIVLALTADEESSGGYGLGWLLSKHRGLLEAAFAVNEGGNVVLEEGAVRFVEVQTGEKIYVDLKLSATGPSGHSSMPERENAIYRLSRALARLAQVRLPFELTETTRAYFEGMARAGGPEAPAMRRLLSGRAAAARSAADELSSKPHLNALLRTTFVATMLDAGTRVNVLPSLATANVNCRVMPGTDLRAFIRKMEALVGDPKVKVTHDPGDLVPCDSSPVDHPLFDAVRMAAGAHFPRSVVVPFMSAGATDSRFLRRMGMPCYGILPFPITREDDRRMHAADERVPLASIEPALKFMHSVILEACR
jgi:acetylornithine deacetylase/succinyl-diaminopimelate desuccinylase-like protein